MPAPAAPKLALNQEEELIRQFLTLGSSAYSERGNWWQMQLKSRSIRRGVLSDLDWPYAGSSNPNIPMTDGFVRAKKATLLSVLGVDPPTQVDILDEKSQNRLGWRLEQWMADTYSNKMRVRRLYEPLVDGYLERSGYFVKVGYEREVEYQEETVDLDQQSPLDMAMFQALEQISLPEAFAAAYKMDLNDERDAKEIGKAVKQYEAGKRQIRLNRKVVIKDQPHWGILSGPEVVRLAGMPKDIQLHPWFFHRFPQTIRQVREKVRAKFYEPHALEQVADVVAGAGSQDYSEKAGEEAQRIAENLITSAGAFKGNGSGPFNRESVEVETWEVYTWWSPDPERIPARRARFTMFPAFHQGRFVRRGWMKRGYFPFQEFDYDNPSQDTYGGRSVPMMIESIAVQVNMLHKAYLDMLPWLCSMSGTFNSQLLTNKSGAPFALTPGEFIPAKGPNALEPVRPPTGGQELLGEVARLQSAAEGLLGPLQAVTNRRENVKGSDPTATEVQAQQQAENVLSGMEVDSFQEAMNTVHEMTLDEMIDNMPEVVRFPYRGPNGDTLFDEIRREELQGIRMRIRAHGNLRNSSTAASITRVSRWMAWATEAAAFGVPVNVAKILRDGFQADGARNPDEYVQQPQALPVMGGANVQPSVPVPGQVPPGQVPVAGGPAPGQAPVRALPAGAAR